MEIINQPLFEQLINEALKQEFSGWDFRYLANRWNEASLSWEYPKIVRSHIKPEFCMLDMDTGGGEMLSSFMPLPKNTYATEGYPPNVPIARNRLKPLGVKVIQVWGDDILPFENDYFD
ncbi:MAG: hypothetical protein QM730_09060 [Anaerolineales bacterium]